MKSGDNVKSLAHSRHSLYPCCKSLDAKALGGSDHYLTSTKNSSAEASGSTRSSAMLDLTWAFLDAT